MSTKKVYALMIFATLFWSGAFITGKLAMLQFPVFSLTFFRFLFALPLIFLLLVKRQTKNVWPSKRQWLPLLAMGIIGTLAYHVLFFSSLKYTTATNSSLIGATLPMVTTILSAIFLHEKITLLRATGISIAFVGIFMVVSKGQWELIATLHFNPGDALMFAAVCCWAVYMILNRVFMDKYKISPLVLTTYTFLVCVIACIPGMISEHPLTWLPAITLSGWLSVMYMAIFASVLGYLFQSIAVQRIGAAKTSTFVNLVPAFTIVESALCLNESITVLTVTSALVIIAGVYLATRSGSVAGASLRLTEK